MQGTTNMIDVALDPKPAKVSFNVEEDARISIDGRPIGIAPLTIDVRPARTSSRSSIAAASPSCAS